MALGGKARDKALADFHARWKGEPLVLDKWFAIQAREESSEEALDRVMDLTGHADFDRRNPNRLRALVRTFASFNPARFHDPSGAGYFLADQIIATDEVNPMTAARFVEPLGSWRRCKRTRRPDARRTATDRRRRGPVEERLRAGDQGAGKSLGPPGPAGEGNPRSVVEKSVHRLPSVRLRLTAPTRGGIR